MTEAPLVVQPDPGSRRRLRKLRTRAERGVYGVSKAWLCGAMQHFSSVRPWMLVAGFTEI